MAQVPATYAPASYTAPLAYGMESRLNDPAMDPNYAYYQARVNATNSGRFASYQKAKKIHDIGDLNDKMAYDNLMADVDKYTKLAQSDYIKGLQKTDMNLADALQKATESYGAGNLLGSGVAVARSTEMINDADVQKNDFLDAKNQAIDKYKTEGDRAKAKYEQVTQPLNDLSKPKYSPMGMPTRETFAQTPQNFISQ